MVELGPGQNNRDRQNNAPVASETWDSEINAAWARIPDSVIAGSKAAAAAAKVLGLSKLSDSPYKNLQGLLDASEGLRARWTRNGNAILKLVPSS